MPAMVLPARSLDPICCIWRSKLYLGTDVQAILSKLRTRKFHTFIRPETNQAGTLRNHKRLVEQLESIGGLRFRLDEEISFHLVC